MQNMSGLKIYRVDAFTDVPYKGNPAGVMITEKPLSSKFMQDAAFEMNLSETAFAYPIDNTDIKKASLFKLRWFTPTTEVNACGHATLATAKVLFDIIENDNAIINFDSLSGVLSATRVSGQIAITFRSDVIVNINEPDKNSDYKQILSLFDISRVVEMGYGELTGYLLIELNDCDYLESLNISTKLALLELTNPPDGLIVTAKGDRINKPIDDYNINKESLSTSDVYDCYSRFFAPWCGISEDPVTGSAHTVLSVYWSRKLSKNTLKCYQCSKRGGVVMVKIDKNNTVISGYSVITMVGDWLGGIYE